MKLIRVPVSGVSSDRARQHAGMAAPDLLHRREGELCLVTGPEPIGKEKGRLSMALVFSDDFLDFWKEYPRRVAKIAAFKAFLKAVKLGVENEVIIAGVRKYRTAVAGKDPEYIAHPATWLNAGRWDDEYPDHAATTVNGKGNGSGSASGRPQPPSVVAATLRVIAANDQRKGKASLF
jgi:hypothetical protein